MERTERDVGSWGVPLDGEKQSLKGNRSLSGRGDKNWKTLERDEARERKGTRGKLRSKSGIVKPVRRETR